MKPTLLALTLLLPLSVQAATDIQRWRNRDGTKSSLSNATKTPSSTLKSASRVQAASPIRTAKAKLPNLPPPS